MRTHCICGAWTSIDELRGMVFVQCSRIVCSTHNKGIRGVGDTPREAIENFKDMIEDARDTARATANRSCDRGDTGGRGGL
jgi:hypothetical protein